MASPVYYRGEAEHCRKLAERSSSPIEAKRWRQLGAEYDLLANSFERSDRRSRPPQWPSATPVTVRQSAE